MCLFILAGIRDMIASVCVCSCSCFTPDQMNSTVYVALLVSVVVVDLHAIVSYTGWIYFVCITLVTFNV